MRGFKKIEGLCTASKAMVDCVKKDGVKGGIGFSACSRDLVGGPDRDRRVGNTFLIDAMTVIRSVNVLEVCRK